MRLEGEPNSLSEAVWAYGRGDESPAVLRWLTPRPLPKRIIGEWEAEAYLQMYLDDVRRNAEGLGFSVGRTPGSLHALQKIGQRFREGLEKEFIIIKT